MKVGGTLFHGMLDGSPEVLVLPEPMFFRLLAQRRYQDARHRALDWLTGNRSVMIQPQGSPPPGFRAEIETEPVPPNPQLTPSQISLEGSIRGSQHWVERFDMARFHTLLKTYLDHGAVDGPFVMKATALAFFGALKPKPQQLPQYWAFREIETARASLSSPIVRRQNFFLEHFLDWFPQGKVLFQVRDPRAVTLSRSDHFRNARPSGREASRFYFFEDAKICKASFQQLNDLQKQISPSRLRVVKYEDLVAEPRSVAQQMAEFLSLNSSDSWLKPTTLGLPNKVITAKTFDGSAVVSTRTERWRSEIRGRQRLLLEAMLWDGHGICGRGQGYQSHFPGAVVWATQRWLLLHFLRRYQTGRYLPEGLRRPLRFYGFRKFPPAQTPRQLAGNPTALNRTVEELKRRLIQRGLVCHGRVLDLGADHGLWALALGHTAKQVDTVIAQPEAGRFWKAFFKDRELHHIRVIDEPTAGEEKYDLVHAREVRDPIPNSAFLQDLKSLVHPGGRLYCTVPGRARNFFHKQRPSPWFDHKEFRALLTKAGFTMEYMGFAYSSVDREPYPARFGPWYRELDALCILPGPFGSSWT